MINSKEYKNEINNHYHHEIDYIFWEISIFSIFFYFFSFSKFFKIFMFHCLIAVDIIIKLANYNFFLYIYIINL